MVSRRQMKKIAQRHKVSPSVRATVWDVVNLSTSWCIFELEGPSGNSSEDDILYEALAKKVLLTKFRYTAIEK